MSQVDSDVRKRHSIDRSLSCRLPDIDADFSGRLEDGTVHGLVAQADPAAQIKLTVASDDLVALTEGRLNFATAWATGRLRVDANMFDLLKLRSLL